MDRRVRPPSARRGRSPCPALPSPRPAGAPARPRSRLAFDLLAHHRRTNLQLRLHQVDAWIGPCRSWESSQGFDRRQLPSAHASASRRPWPPIRTLPWPVLPWPRPGRCWATTAKPRRKRNRRTSLRGVCRESSGCSSKADRSRSGRPPVHRRCVRAAQKLRIKHSLTTQLSFPAMNAQSPHPA